MNKNVLTLAPRRIAGGLAATALLLVLINLAGQCSRYLLGHDHVFGLVNLFDLDVEKNIPTLFSVFLLAFAALLLLAIALLKRRERDPETSRWAVLAFGFALMATDESWSFHERLITPMRGMLGDNTSALFFFAWVVPALALVLVVGVLFFRFMLHLPASTRWRFLFSGAVYLGGAIGMEGLGGRYAKANGLENLAYNLFVTVEESMEMGGSILFIHALLDYIAEHYGEIGLRFSRD